ncbi:sensor histidine kinase [Clostridium sp. SGI.024]|uniref:sensor histidine kinase n=1 Tax=Clostridium sp. TaxID=1506 RepID=UPI0025C67EA3|nr:ATP-binding protein [Clostridium sp.]MDY2630868.1 ATP-binding protein [Clostridium sp.]MDY4252217.1 ATP-binding protein [Clostridium sp.]
MFSSLNKKVKVIYIFLGIIIFFIWSLTAVGLYITKNSATGSISNSYKSIDSIKSMINAVNNQEKAILIYLQGDKEKAINIFHTNDDEFYKWLYIAKGNITDDKETQLIDKVNYEYIEFGKLFSLIQDYSNGENHDELVKFYNEKIEPQVLVVIEDLNNLEKLNEDIILIERDTFQSKTKEVIYSIALFFLVVAIIFGVIIFILINRYFYAINLLVYSLNDSIILLDKDYKIKFINKNGIKLFQINEKDYKKKYLLDLINLPEIYNLIQEYEVSKENNKIIEIIYKNKRLYLQIDISSNTNKNRRNKDILLVIKDTTEVIESETANKNLIYTISHELKTPLTSIMMGIGLIKNDSIGKLNIKQKDIVDTMEEDVQKLNELVSDLLKVYEIQSNRNSLNKKSYDISKIIGEAFSNFEFQAKEKNISLKLNLNSKLPYVMIDTEKIKWVLNNLISNAIRYTENGIVQINAKYDKEKIFVSVTDTGRGIPEEYLNKVFERFVRVEGFDIPQESTGLGLAIAKEIVEIHGGEIWCESKTGVGSKFTFTIPLNKN